MSGEARVVSPRLRLRQRGSPRGAPSSASPPEGERMRAYPEQGVPGRQRRRARGGERPGSEGAGAPGGAPTDKRRDVP